MDGIRGVVQEDVGILRAEIQKYLSIMMEQIEFIRGKWEGMEVDRKEKGVAFGSETNTTPKDQSKLMWPELSRRIGNVEKRCGRGRISPEN